MTGVSRRLSECPELGHVVREYDAVYRHGSAGGSPRIRGHLDDVREATGALLDSDPEVLAREPRTLPVVDHLPRVLDRGRQADLADLCDSLDRVAHLLTWEYGYEQVPEELVASYAYAEVVGPRGPVLTERLILGLVLLAPGTTYPDHHHTGIEESYVAVSGAWSQNDAAVHVPGSLVLNPAGQEHRITTGRRDPCLLAYAWLAPADRLEEPDMHF